MLIDTVDHSSEKDSGEFDPDSPDEVEINDDNIEDIMKHLDKYK